MDGFWPPSHRRYFDVAIICALQVEADAAENLFDHFWDRNGDQYGKANGDQNSYRTGVIGNHNVVLAYMPGMGKGNAASVAASFRSSFQGIRLAIILGICGGVPNGTKDGIFLGDIIIGSDIVIHDLGRKLPGCFRRKEGITDPAMNLEVRAFLHKLSSQRGRGTLKERTHFHLGTLQGRANGYCRPKHDRLFAPTYKHKHYGTSRCKKCKKDDHCKKAHDAPCEALGCDPAELIHRFRPSPNQISIHFGRIASGDTVMKSGVDRDRIAARDTIIAFEMEGAGICNNLPCIVVKSVCDYADSHKDKAWQEYAAGAAAACMKSLLEQWAAVDHPDKRHEIHKVPVQVAELCSFNNLPQTPSSNGDEANNSQRYHEETSTDILKVLSTTKPNFKSAIDCLKKCRNSLPRDTDLKRILKNQRLIMTDILEYLETDISVSVDEHLGSSKEICLQLAAEIKRKLEEIEIITNGLPATTKAKVQPESPLKNAVEDLGCIVGVLRSEISREQTPRSSDEARMTRTVKEHHEFQHFRIVQQAACNLYDSFRTACHAHSVHDVHLSLKPDLNGTLTQVRFNLALIQDPSVTTTGKAVWISVESSIKPSDDSFQSSSSTFSTPFTSQKRSRVCEEGPCPPRIKRVQFQQLEAISGPVQAPSQEKTPITIPKLFLQRNLCTLVQRSLCQGGSGGCIGLLRDDETCKHLAYIDTQTNSGTTSASSLAQLLSRSASKPTRDMGPYECVQLAKYLATAVLYYHATPWLQKAWRSNDVHFLGDHESHLQQTRQALPYITTSIQASASVDSTNTESFVYRQLIRNPVLFGLGIMFIELTHQVPITALEEHVDQVKGGTREFVEYFTADRLVTHSNQIVSNGFREIIRKCLHCDFGHNSDFSSPALQEAFHRDVIVGLENLERRLRDLQLNDV
ncbi:hypothetical protein AnigIFM63309_004452 [Aspergillus niger]|nr:hypothetical protein AnigIFM63309_004452 [Aspergillus niger]